MKIKKIFYPTPLEEVDRYDDNIDVCVILDNCEEYVLEVATPQNIYTLMSKDNLSYLEAGTPFAFVKELTHENIIALVESFIEHDAYWLKLYHYECGAVTFPPYDFSNSSSTTEEESE